MAGLATPLASKFLSFPAPAGPIPDSGFTVAHEPVINHRNDSEIYAFHTGGAQACFADGSTRFLRSDLDTVVGIALVTRAGGEVMSNNGE